MSREIPLMREFLAFYRNPIVRLFRRNILNKTMQDIHSGKVHQVKAGVVGQADVYGFIKGVIATPFEIEFKGLRTPTSEAQNNWRSFCIEWGILHITLRAGKDEDDKDTLRRWGKELDMLINSAK